MTLKEMLKSDEAKKMYRELAKKLHPDTSDGDAEMMVKVNALKNDSKKKDREIKTIYNEIFGNKIKTIKKWANNIKNRHPIISMVNVIESDGIKTIFSYYSKEDRKTKNIIFTNTEKFNSEKNFETEFKKELTRI